MNYLKQLNAFFELLFTNPLSPKAICLYSTLLHINNKCLWKKRFKVANTTLMSITSIDRRTLDRVRNELVQKGYIEYKKGNGNQAGEYTIINLCVQYDTQYDIQCDTQSDIQDDHINKQNKTDDDYIYNILHARTCEEENELNDYAKKQLEIFKQVIKELCIDEKFTELDNLTLQELERLYEYAQNANDPVAYIKSSIVKNGGYVN